MAEAVSRRAWDLASHQMALFANANRDHKKQRPFNPEDFNPMRRPVRQQADISVLKALLPREQ